MRKINKLIVHCSDSGFGDAELVRRWHIQPKMPDDVALKIKNKKLPRSTAKHYGNGWSDIGYHYVILNGFRKPGQAYNPLEDGLVEPGRPVAKSGAHCRGNNKKSIGVCLIGVRLFSAKQLYEALPKLIRRIGLDTVGEIELVGHYELDGGKTCPNIDMDMLRAYGNTPLLKQGRI